uniref:Uncharacterized protein n=1 Tax=viral metagenome TaxID=1070528 RepID=A0A6M3LXY2_9ZZZZ
MNEKEATEIITQIWDVINDWADNAGSIKAVDAFEEIHKIATFQTDLSRDGNTDVRE